MKTMQVLEIKRQEIKNIEVEAYTLGISDVTMFAKAVNTLRIKDAKDRLAKSFQKITVRLKDVREADYNPVKLFDNLGLDEYEFDSSDFSDECSELKMLDGVSKTYLYDGEIPDFIKVRATLYIAAIDNRTKLGMALVRKGKSLRLEQNPIDFGEGSTELYEIALKYGEYGIPETDKQNHRNEFVEALKKYAKQFETKKSEFTMPIKLRLNKRVVDALLRPLGETLVADKQTKRIIAKPIFTKDQWLCLLTRALFRMPLLDADKEEI